MFSGEKSKKKVKCISCLEFVGILWKVQIHPCEPNPCANNGECTVSGTDAICACVEGWTGPICDVDIDECLADSGICNQACTNTPGSYQCSCYYGYTVNADRHSCDAINECPAVLADSECDPSCANLLGSCLCSDGYHCQDTNECDISNGGCNQKCTNTDGGYFCECESTYILGDDDHTCEDACTIDNVGPKMDALGNIYKSFTDRPMGNDTVPESLQATKNSYDAYLEVFKYVNARGNFDGHKNQLAQALDGAKSEVDKQAAYITYYVRLFSNRYMAQMFAELAQAMLDSPDADQLDDVFKTRLAEDVADGDTYLAIHAQAMDSCDLHGDASSVMDGFLTTQGTTPAPATCPTPEPCVCP